jgi:hypothetical protein
MCKNKKLTILYQNGIKLIGAPTSHIYYEQKTKLMRTFFLIKTIFLLKLFNMEIIAEDSALGSFAGTIYLDEEQILYS